MIKNKKNFIFLIIPLFILVMGFALPVRAEDPEGCCGFGDVGFIRWETKLKSKCITPGCDHGGNICPQFEANKIVIDGKCVAKTTTTTTIKTSENIKFIPQISIPDSGIISGKAIEIPANATPLADYIVAIFKYSTGIIGVIAAIVLMYAGMRWMTAGGNSSTVSEAKKYIVGSLSGLVLTLGAFLLLTTINLNLVNLVVPDIKYIKYEAIDTPKTKEELDFALQTSHPMYQGEKPTGDLEITKINNKKNITYKTYEDKTNKIYNTKTFSLINEAKAQSYFEGPKSIPLIMQDGVEVFNKNYARYKSGTNKCDPDCYETTNLDKKTKWDVKMAGVECDEEDPFSGNKWFSTVATSGCGVLSLQMVLASYGKAGTDADTTMKMIKFMESNDTYRVCPNRGTQPPGFYAYAQQQNIGMEVEEVDLERAKELIRNKYPVIANLKSDSGCTKGGHYVVLRGMKGNTIQINNPITSANCKDTLPKGDAGINGLWFIHPAGKSPMIEESSGSCIDNYENCSGYGDKNCCGDTPCYWNASRWLCTNNKWIPAGNWGCLKDSECGNLKCLYDGPHCPGWTTAKANNPKCRQCLQCLNENDWGCRNNNDCCGSLVCRQNGKAKQCKP